MSKCRKHSRKNRPKLLPKQRKSVNNSLLRKSVKSQMQLLKLLKLVMQKLKRLNCQKPLRGLASYHPMKMTSHRKKRRRKKMMKRKTRDRSPMLEMEAQQKGTIGSRI